MPIAFPPPKIGNAFDDAARVFSRAPFDVTPAPNLSRPGVPFTMNLLAPGGPYQVPMVNLRRLSRMYEAIENTAVINPIRVWVTNNRLYDRVQASLNGQLAGVSRDATGAPLGNCRVMIFRSADLGFMLELVSDGSGNWATGPITNAGAVFLVEYLAGSPDRAGTSVNTIALEPIGG